MHPLYAWAPLYLSWEMCHTMATHHHIIDVGWICTTPLFSWLKKHERCCRGAACINTLLLIYCIVYLMGQPPLWKPTLLTWLLRACLGSMTRLPLTKDYLTSLLEFPPRKMGFFFIFSGHTSLVYLTFIPRCSYALGCSLLLLQSIRLLAIRGHYTIDLFLGIIIPHYILHVYYYNGVYPI